MTPRPVQAQDTGSPHHHGLVKSPLLRVGLFLLGYMVILFVASIPKGMAPPLLADIVWGVIASILTFAFTRFLLAREQRTPREIGLEADARSIARLLAGFATGIAVYAATVAVVSLTLGPIRLSASTPPSATTWVVTIASCLALSCMEELGFRAYALRTLVPAVGLWPAQVSIAVAFGLAHLVFGWPWPTVVMGVVPSALLFGVVAIRSGGLAMPIGLHAALNVAYWMAGAKPTPGVWTLSADPAHTERLATFSPFMGAAMTLLAALLIARWPSRRLTPARN